MRRFAIIFLSVVSGAHAQQKTQPEAVAELTPIVIQGTFELSLRPTATELALKAVERLMVEKQTHDDAIARSPFWNARFWSEIPFTFGLSDPKDFALPSYSTANYRGGEAQVRFSEKQTLFNR